MALWCVLHVNDQAIGHFEAVRIEGGTAPDDVNTYEAKVTRLGEPTWAGRVEHRYGDGAWALVRTVLAAAGDQSGEVPS